MYRSPTRIDRSMTEVWGPHFWNAMHYAAIGYMNRTDPSLRVKEAYARFYESLAFALPCKVCARHYRALLRKHPVRSEALHVEGDGQRRLFDWTVLIHNRVNARLKKREWASEEAYEHYRKRLGVKDDGDDEMTSSMYSGGSSVSSSSASALCAKPTPSPSSLASPPDRTTKVRILVLFMLFILVAISVGGGLAVAFASRYRKN